MIISTFFKILVNILYCDVDDWYCGGLLCWSKRVACMVLLCGLNSYWECFLILANVNEYFLLDVMNIILFDFNTCKHSILVMFVIGFVVGCCVGASGWLACVIRCFKFILGVFLVSCKCKWNLLIRYDICVCNVYLFKYKYRLVHSWMW